MSMLFLILGIILMIGAIILAFRPIIPSVLPAYVAMWLLDTSNHISINKNTLLFWGLATSIVLFINMSKAQDKPDNKGLGYIVAGTIVGSFVGMATNASGIIPGAAIGAFLGAVAYSRTPNGKCYQFPSKKFINQLASKGLPAIVTMCIIATIISFILPQTNTSIQ